MHQQGDEANIPPVLIPRRMFVVGPPLLISPGEGRIGVVTEEWRAVSLQYSTTKKGHTAQAIWWYGVMDKEMHGTTGWLEVSLDGNFLVWAGEPGKCVNA